MRPSRAARVDPAEGSLGEAALAVGDALFRIALPGALPLLALQSAALMLFKSPALLALGYAWMGMASASLYWLDKRRAQRQGTRRIPEAVLLAVDFLGGWMGGIAAQQGLRHKTSKPAYRAKFWALVAVHLVCLVWVAVKSF